MQTKTFISVSFNFVARLVFLRLSGSRMYLNFRQNANSIKHTKKSVEYKKSRAETKQPKIAHFFLLFCFLQTKIYFKGKCAIFFFFFFVRVLYFLLSLHCVVIGSSIPLLRAYANVYNLIIINQKLTYNTVKCT